MFTGTKFNGGAPIFQEMLVKVRVKEITSILVIAHYGVSDSEDEFGLFWVGIDFNSLKEAHCFFLLDSADRESDKTECSSLGKQYKQLVG